MERRGGQGRSGGEARASHGVLTGSSKAKKPVNASVHTYTRSQTPSTRIRSPGWRIHGGVEDINLSTNKQHTLYIYCSWLQIHSQCVLSVYLLR
jgi:hypothetical protein